MANELDRNKTLSPITSEIIEEARTRGHENRTRGAGIGGGIGGMIGSFGGIGGAMVGAGVGSLIGAAFGDSRDQKKQN